MSGSLSIWRARHKMVLRPHMAENLEIRILLPADKTTIMDFAKGRLAAEVPDPVEREMQSWGARWRGEALDHYLPQGWSFGVFAESGEMQGYILGQPYLFFRGLTQTLWIEHVDFATPHAAHQLLDTAHRWARDKHLQCVLVENNPALQPLMTDWKQAHPIEGEIIEIKSSRFER